jgi:hypothetical protein
MDRSLLAVLPGRDPQFAFEHLGHAGIAGESRPDSDLVDRAVAAGELAREFVRRSMRQTSSHGR